MKIHEVAKAEPKPNPHGADVRMLYNHESAQAIHITLKPGESLKRHITPTDVFFYILEGRGTVEVGEEKQEVSADTLVESPANIVHCLYNTGKEDFRVLVVKAPRPVNKSTIL
jgi:quercetin dioxygenase-like cupin family protein